MSEVTRRAVLGGALTSAAILASSSLRGQQAQDKSQSIFLDYDQEALDRAYDQTPWAPNMDEIFERRDQKAELARARLGSPQQFSYGPSEIEQLDVYATSAALAPIHVFVHGGTWRFGGECRELRR